MQQIIDKIIEKINENKEDFPEFVNSNYKTYKISKENFHEINKIESNKKIIFVDGGNLELIKAPNLSLFFNRIYYCVYEKNKRVKNGKYEFYTLIAAENKSNKLFFNAEVHWTKNNSNSKEFVFAVDDRTLSFGKKLVGISDIGNAVRKLMELEIASQIIEDIKNSILVLDRNLEVTITYEQEMMGKLYNIAKTNNIIICALSKTSSLLTRNGNSVNALLNKIGPDLEWYYYPIADINNKEHEANIYFVKLNKKSNYVFRLDTYKEMKYDINEILTLLIENSKDPVFLGYPYGLIEADRFARVSNKEIEFLRIQLFVKMGKNAENVKRYLTSEDAHSILNNIS